MSHHHHHQLYHNPTSLFITRLWDMGPITSLYRTRWMPLTIMYLRGILRIPYADHVTNATVRLQAGLPPQLSQLIQARRLRFFSHAARMDTTHQHNITRLYSAIHFSSRWKIQDRRQVTDTNNTETKNNPENQTTQNTAKQNYACPYPDLVAFYDTWPGNEVGLFYNAPEQAELTWGLLYM